MKHLWTTLLLLCSLFFVGASCSKSSKIDVLIIDGQNNHTVWPKSTMMMKRYLEDTGKFNVGIERTIFTWKGAKWLPQYPLNDGKNYQELKEPVTDPDYSPDFSQYDVVISNFGWRAADLPEGTRQAMEKFVSRGGGFVSVHAADNSWPSWKEFNRMIGLGGWGGRTEKDGPYVYYNDQDELIRDMTPGRGGSHGEQHQFLVRIREPNHPITKGMPEQWLHTQDECYDRLRGPAENMTVLATAWSDPETRGTGRHEPMLMALEYGKGRVFHTTLGHEDYSFEGVGFIISLLRGTEWAATGKVTIPIPEDFPTRTEAKHRPFK